MTPDPIKQAIESLEYAFDIYGDEDGPWPHIGNALTALRQHQQDGGWLPIESAPRDGTPFLAYVKKTHSGLMPKNRVFRISLTKKGWCCGNNYFNESQLTHWQPLPPAPKKENDDGKN